MPTTDGEIVMMSKRRYDEMCTAIDALKRALKRPVFLDPEEAKGLGYIESTECSAEEE